MAEVTVFVDDAVLGALPPLCAKDGVATPDSLQVSNEVGGGTGLGVAWLLLLAGPLGWLGLFVISATRASRGEAFTVRIPLSEPAYERMRAARRLRRLSLLAAGLAGLATLAGLVGPGDATGARMLLALSVVALITTVVIVVVADRRLSDEQIGVELDASRRWVRLSQVHPGFAAACQEQVRERQRT
jgi:hypothetical protein